MPSPLLAPREPARSSRTGSLLALVACVLGLVGCQSLGSTASGPGSLQRAETLAQRGDHAAAAREFDKLAEDNPGTAGNDYQLAAAREWLAANRPAEARRAGGGRRHADARTGLRAAAAEHRTGARGRRRERVPGSSCNRWPSLPAIRPSNSAIWGCASASHLRPAGPSRASAPSSHANGSQQTPRSPSLALRRELFAQLREAETRGTRLDPAAAGSDALLRGWLDLGPVAAALQRGGKAAAEIAAWRARHGAHPAAELLSADLSAPTPASGLASGSHVAVLLPISGRTANAAAQIRDGLLAGYYAMPASGRPALRIYDTGATSMVEVLNEATRAGADFIIGPLTREEVTAAASVPARRPPLLALNFLAADAAAPAGFFQFALSPEDEARLAARRALDEGRRRAVAWCRKGTGAIASSARSRPSSRAAVVSCSIQ